MKNNIINFRAAKQLIKDLNKIMKDGHYRNRTELINDALRTFIRNYRTFNPNSKNKVKKK